MIVGKPAWRLRTVSLPTYRCLLTWASAANTGVSAESICAGSIDVVTNPLVARGGCVMVKRVSTFMRAMGLGETLSVAGALANWA